MRTIQLVDKLGQAGDLAEMSQVCKQIQSAYPAYLFQGLHHLPEYQSQRYQKYEECRHPSVHTECYYQGQT
ncbi:hypothetical protein vBKpnAMK4_00001 [Klebsiella phage vB_Kpn_AM_K4]